MTENTEWLPRRTERKAGLLQAGRRVRQGLPEEHLEARRKGWGHTGRGPGGRRPPCQASSMGEQEGDQAGGAEGEVLSSGETS